MSAKIAYLLLQILFFFLALTLISFLAEVIYQTSRGTSFWVNCQRWAAHEIVFNKILLKIAASGLYVLFRNRRILVGHKRSFRCTSMQ